uniref:Trematode PH-like domain-containing protein n=1 Tax=Trichobilharzia regenti TaxID=157069 RepID=A0AA85IMF7_TRIRE|nr:unnamed protein product [Trichobilharzia regenti]
MPGNKNGQPGEEPRFEDLIRFAGAKTCADSEDAIKENAASLILTKVGSKKHSSSHLKCYGTYLTFYPEVSESGVKMSGHLLLREIRGFYVSQKHPKSLVILFQHSGSDDVTMYGVVMSSSEKARRLTMLLSEPNPPEARDREPNHRKTKSVTITPKAHNSSAIPPTDLKDVQEVQECPKGLPPPGNRFRSEYTLNKTGSPPKKNHYSAISPTLNLSGRLSHENYPARNGKHRSLQPKVDARPNTQRIGYDYHTQIGPELSRSDRNIPPKTPSHVSFQVPVRSTAAFSGDRYHSPYISAFTTLSSDRFDEDGCDTPFPYDPNENIEEFSIGYYNNEYDSKLHESDVLHSNADLKNPAENPWVENITYISSSKNGTASVTSNGPVYLYVAQQVNPRIEAFH